MATAAGPTLDHVTDLLGDDATDLLEHRCETISASRLHLPGPAFIDRVMVATDRSTATLRNLRQMFDHGRLGGTGYLSILPVDQGIEHSAAASFAPNPDYFDPAKIVELAIEGGGNAVASTVGVLGGFKQGDTDYHLSADLTGQANHLGVTIEADIIKQKLAENNNGYGAMNQNGSSYGKTSPLVYSELSSEHPIDLCRYQVANCYMGRSGLINSGGASSGESDLAEAVRTAVINKRAGGTGLISGRKAFQRPLSEGIEILNAIQDVYLAQDIGIA